MTGVVRVVMGGQPTRAVTIRDNIFDPSDVTVGMGGTVTWQNQGINQHSATEAAAGTLPSYSLNGRTFVGNTPIVMAESGRRIRWYLFNLDLEMTWHNFHLHGARWRWGRDTVDTRGLNPAESFVADTVVPPVVQLPDPGCEDEASERQRRGELVVPPVSVSPAWTLARSPFTSRRSQAVLAHGGHGHPAPSHGHGGGSHGGGSHSGGSHGGGSDYEPERVRVRGDFLIHCHVEPHMMQGMADLVRALQDLGHAFLPDGRVCVAGGASSPGVGIRFTHLFDPTTEQWTKVADMAQPRWYPDPAHLGRRPHPGRLRPRRDHPRDLRRDLLAAGRGRHPGLPRAVPEPAPDPLRGMFYSRCGWNASDLTQPATGYLRFTGPTAGFLVAAGRPGVPRPPGGRRRSPDRRLCRAARGPTAGVRRRLQRPGQRPERRADRPDRAGADPRLAAHRRPEHPPGQRERHAAARRDDPGGRRPPRPGRFGANDPVFEAEIYHPQTDTWTVQPPMQFPRGYHSVSVLVPDGRVLCAGGADAVDNQFNMEVFSPPYLFMGPRPAVSTAPTTVGHGNPITITTPDEPSIGSVALLRPAAITHHTDAGALERGCRDRADLPDGRCGS